ncbi:MAG: dienelactone hydrolase family protein, partial [Rhodospirillales bacterium]|nr:dienelactone hydrolase family protein [Rhodospirillales bacterium]
MRHFFTALLLGIPLLACGAADPAPSMAVPVAIAIGSGRLVAIPPVPVDGARVAPHPLPGRLRLPPGPGLHAVVIVLHGCGGVGTNQTAWAERLLGWGYGSLVLDSLTPRRIDTVCAHTRQALVTRQDRAGDVIAAARWLARQPAVNPKRIGVLGGSHGGAAAETVTLEPFAKPADGLIRAAVDYYGACRNPEQYGNIPLLALAGEADTWRDPAQVCRQFAAAVGTTRDVTVVTYPNAVHAFDNPRLRERRTVEGHPLQYDPVAAADSYARVHAFLDRTLGPG